MAQFNDYIKLTKGYLKNLSYYEVAVANMTDDVKEIEESLKDVCTKVSKYEQNPGGFTELAAVESEVENRAEQASRFKLRAKELHKMQLQVKKLRRCIDNLSKEEKDALKLFYTYKFSYEDMADELNVSERTCKRRVETGTKAVAIMLFGDKAGDKIMFAS